eukprot:6557244-Alexandrium_andersonii.AAC.1
MEPDPREAACASSFRGRATPQKRNTRCCHMRLLQATTAAKTAGPEGRAKRPRKTERMTRQH